MSYAEKYVISLQNISFMLNKYIKVL